MYQFNPEIVIISTCFNAFNKSSEVKFIFLITIRTSNGIYCILVYTFLNRIFKGYTTITASLFAHFVHSFSCLADGKQLVLVNVGERFTHIMFLVFVVVFFNELCLFFKDKNLHENSFQECTQVCLEQLLGFPVPRIEALTQPKEKLVQTVATSVAILRQYWCCLQLLNDNDTTRTLDEHLENYKRR